MGQDRRFDEAKNSNSRMILDMITAQYKLDKA